MKNPSIWLLAAALAAPFVSAQGGLQTATPYGDAANAGTGNVNAVPAGTAIGASGLTVRAADSNPRTGGHAGAATQVGIMRSTAGAGVTVIVAENGTAGVRGGNARASAGTTDNRGGTPAAHGLSLALAAPQGATAIVTVRWRAGASANASASAAVDVDGDGTPEFGARVGGNATSVSQSFRVQATARGLHIGISTRGHTASGGAPEQYGATLSVDVQMTGGGVQCNFRPFGPECGGKIAGRVASTTAGTRTGLSLTGAAANATAILVIGGPLGTPLQLPNSRCSLLVTPRATTATNTDAAGSANWMLPLPAGALTIAFQAVTVDFGRAGVRLASSNGLGLVCN